MSELKEAIFNKIKELGCGVSFVDLQEIPGFEGSHKWITPPYPKTRYLLWSGMSSEAIKALQELKKEGLIHADLSSIPLYFMDGQFMLPIKGVMWIPATWSVCKQ